MHFVFSILIKVTDFRSRVKIQNEGLKMTHSHLKILTFWSKKLLTLTILWLKQILISIEIGRFIMADF